MVINNVVVRLVAGEAAGVVAVYARAVAQADRMRALLVAADLDLDAVLVVPSVTAAGQPVVYLTGLTDPARIRLDRILRSSAGAPSQDTSPVCAITPSTRSRRRRGDGIGGKGLVTWEFWLVLIVAGSVWAAGATGAATRTKDAPAATARAGCDPFTP